MVWNKAGLGMRVINIPVLLAMGHQSRVLYGGIESAALAPSLLFIWPDHQVIRPAPQPLRYWKFTFQCIANTKYAS